MNEATIIKTLELPHGQEWAWYADANVVVLSPCLDTEGRDRALTAVQAFWRRSCLRVVGSDDVATRTVSPCAQTQPSPTIRQVIELL